MHACMVHGAQLAARDVLSSTRLRVNREERMRGRRENEVRGWGRCETRHG